MDLQDFKKELTSLFTANDDGVNVATRSLNEYFSERGDRYTGSLFEALSDQANPNHITGRDIHAVNSLSVDIPIRPALWILSREGSDAINHLLSQVPTDVDIWSPEAEKLLAPDGPLWKLWDLLGVAHWPLPKSKSGHNEMGQTKRSKLLAAKRPRIVPITDSVVREVFPGITNYWEAFRHALCDDGLREMIHNAASNASMPKGISVLRTVDVVVWMSRRQSK